MDPKAASEVLNRSGIPGTTYSEPRSTGAGTAFRKTIGSENVRNYDVFDPSTVEILRKYGIAGLIGGGGALGLGAASSSAQAAEGQVSDVQPGIVHRLQLQKQQQMLHQSQHP